MPEFGKENVLYFSAICPNDLAKKIELFYKNINILKIFEEKAKLHSKKFIASRSAFETWQYLLNNATN